MQGSTKSLSVRLVAALLDLSRGSTVQNFAVEHVANTLAVAVAATGSGAAARWFLTQLFVMPVPPSLPA